MNHEDIKPQLSAAQEPPLRKRKRTRRCNPSNRRVLPSHKCKATGPNLSITPSPSQHQTQLSTDRKTSRDIFPWKELAGELKNDIYTYVLTVPEPIHLFEFNTSTRVMKRDRTFLPFTSLGVNLLLANKATYREGAPILYGQNDFRFRGPRDLDNFLVNIRSWPLQWLKRVQLHVRDGPLLDLGFVPNRMYNLLGEAPELEKFVLVEDSCYRVDGQKLAQYLCSSLDAHTWLTKLVSEGGLSTLDRIFTRATWSCQVATQDVVSAKRVKVENMWHQPEVNHVKFREELKALVATDASNFLNEKPEEHLQLSDTDSEESP
ncbi:Short-chain dehydrogenase reductase sdr protein [Lasiodiplodia theobromae]|uniref:Short-chain dehydrogenase reductase sdr protein n=1 Tax=Lasiodiplodia theobromae TaxID=45133 RepID=UPI0015C3BE18|nr:Short-chain dehydrogenase reductase sdr protein [Lasiodiplodia theobromae]KAF4536898.1 Short-chain dehydrogenase reductase sdr protein [Lasiodiplodia theobromae]